MNQLTETLGNVLTAATANRPMGSDELTPVQRDAVGYFFARLKTADPSQYAVLIPSDKTRIALSRTYAPYIKDFTRDQVDAGFDRFHKLRQGGDERFRWLNIDQVIGLIAGTLKLEAEENQAPAGIYKYFEPLALPDKTAEEKARKAGASELQKLKGMF